MEKKISLRICTALITLSLSIVGTLAVLAQTITFNFERNLTIGSRGADVLELQKTFNLRARTRLATSGPGSPGQETRYFGPLTRAAAIKYQEFYIGEVLTPVGLTKGTGFVGPSTRKKLNQIQNKTVIQEKTILEKPKETVEDYPISPVGTSIFSVETDKVALMYPSHYDGRVGDRVTLYGVGFDPSSNTVHFGSETIFNASSLDGSQLTFTIPNVTPNRYSISISNSRGNSESIFFNILENNAVPPVIDRIEPVSGVGATVVTIYGSGFKPTGNTVYTGYSTIENVSSSDGKTIVITMFPPYENGVGIDEVESYTYRPSIDPPTVINPTPDIIYEGSETMWIYVENTGGFSNNATYDYYYNRERALHGM